MADNEVNRVRRQFEAGKIGRRELIRKALAAGVGGAALPGLLAACTAPAPSAPATSAAAPSSTAANKPTAATAATTPTAATAAAAKKAATQEIVIAQGLYPPSLDPALAPDQSSLNVIATICEPLITKNFDTGMYDPVLATSWKLTEKTWEFALRQGIKFTNGEDFNADVVKWNFERVKDPALKSPDAAWWNDLDRIETPDKYTVRFISKSHAPQFLDRQINMIPMGYGQQQGSAGFSAAPIGTGPWKFVSQVRDQKVVVEANPDYRRGKPTLTKVTYTSIPEASTRMAALKTGDVQLATLVELSAVPSLQQAGVNIVSVPGLRLMHLSLDTTKGGPMGDKRVRQAINYAIDRDTIIKNVLSGYGKKLQGQLLTPDYTPGFNPDLKEYPFDQQQAKTLLQQAGYKGEQLTMYSPKGRYMADTEIAQAIAGQLKDVGLNIDLQVLEFSVWIQKLGAKDLTPIDFIGLSQAGDPDKMLGTYRCGNSFSYYCNDSFDQMLAQAADLPDQKARNDIYKKATELMRDEAPVAFLWQQTDLYGASAKVQGWMPRVDEAIDLYSTSIAE